MHKYTHSTDAHVKNIHTYTYIHIHTLHTYNTYNAFNTIQYNAMQCNVQYSIHYTIHYTMQCNIHYIILYTMQCSIQSDRHIQVTKVQRWVVHEYFRKKTTLK